MDNINSKKGYLTGDFQLFHLKDKKSMQFESHYHDFMKLVIFISGKVTYFIEGKAYMLRPWDILLVSNREIHKVLVEPNEAYERIVVWINPTFLEKHSSRECNLSICFEATADKETNLIRLSPESLKDVKHILSELEDACKSKDFGSGILKNALIIQLMVFLDRVFLGFEPGKDLNGIQFDDNINAVIRYINENLSSDLSIDNISSSFFMSKYYLMHKFKAQTGYSIHNYILQKRLIWANTLIKEGTQAAEASLCCGFKDYSSFVRAFKKMFGLSPREHQKKLMALANLYKGDSHT